MQRGISQYTAAWFDEVIHKLSATIPTIGEYAGYQLLSSSVAVAMLTVSRALLARASKERLMSSTKALVLQDAQELMDASGLQHLEQHAGVAESLLSIIPVWDCSANSLVHLTAFDQLTNAVEQAERGPSQLCWCTFCSSK
jgi:hypothetical protein